MLYVSIFPLFLEDIFRFFENGVFQISNFYARIVYQLSDQTEDANVLFDFLKRTLTIHLTEAMVELKQKQGPYLLREFMVQWNNYLLFSKWLTKVFNYLDRYYLKFSNADSTVLTALKTFKSEVFEKMKVNLVNAVLEEIRKWREGEEVDWNVLHMVIECFITIGINKNAKIENGTAGEGSLKWGGEQNLNEYDSLFQDSFI